MKSRVSRNDGRTPATLQLTESAQLVPPSAGTRVRQVCRNVPEPIPRNGELLVDENPGRPRRVHSVTRAEPARWRNAPVEQARFDVGAVVAENEQSDLLLRGAVGITVRKVDQECGDLLHVAIFDGEVSVLHGLGQCRSGQAVGLVSPGRHR